MSGSPKSIRINVQMGALTPEDKAAATKSCERIIEELCNHFRKVGILDESEQLHVAVHRANVEAELWFNRSRYSNFSDYPVIGIQLRFFAGMPEASDLLAEADVFEQSHVLHR